MTFFNKHKQKLKTALRETKASHFRCWKKGKHWLVGASVLLALTGAVAVLAPQVFQPTIAYAVTNGSITLNQGIIMNSGAVQTGNPEGRVFCIDVATSLDTGANANLTNTGSDAAGLTWTTLSTEQRFQIQTLGWLAFNNAHTSAASDSNMYLAAQELIWDVTTGHGLPDKAADSFYGPDNMDVPEDQAWYEATPGYDPATMLSDMDYLLQAYQTFIKLPKFDTTSQTIQLGQTATFTDANNVLGAYDKITATNGLTTSVSGNKLTVTPTQAGTGTITLSNGGYSDTGNTTSGTGVQVWFTTNPSGNPGQNLIYSAAHPEQSVQVTVKVIPSASLKITKLDTDTKKPIAGAIFVGLNKEGQLVTKDADGKDLANGGKFTTGADGTLTVNHLMADPTNAVGGEAQTIVTLREVSVPAPYTLSNNLISVVDGSGNAKAPSTDLPIVLSPGTTSSNPTGIIFTDKVQVQAIKVQKTATLGGKLVGNFPNGNYSLAGAVFTLKNEMQGTTIGKLYTDNTGWADLSKLAKTGDAAQTPAQYQAILNQLLANGDTYSIQETTAPNGLACDWNGGKAQTFKLSSSGDDTQLINPTVADTTNKHTDTPLTVSTSLTKVDSDTNTDKTQGSALLQGTKETLFYKVDVKDSSGKVLHKADTPVAWADGFSELPITITSGKKADETYVTLQVADNVNKVGVKNLPITATTMQNGYYWAEKDAKGTLTPGYGYTDNTAAFDVASGVGADGTGVSSDKTIIIGADTDLTQADHVLTVGLEFTKVLGDKGSLTGENGAEFQITSADKATQAVIDGLAGQNSKATSGDSTGSDGFTVAGLTKFKFPIGNWTIHQSLVPEGTQAVQDMHLSFTPDPTADGAPKTYTLTIKWADGTQIYTKTFQADDFTNGNSTLINLALGTLTDNKLIPPSLTTKATDKATGSQNLTVGQVTGQDDSMIKDLVAGDYTEVTQWVNQTTGAPIMVDGKPVTASQDFTSKGTGEDKVTTRVSFSDVAFQGQKITAEEFVYPKGKVSGTPIVSETNYKDNTDQTLTIGKVTGSTQVEQKTIAPDVKATYTDDYQVSNLTVGQSYTVKVPNLYDKTTGKEVPATGELTFTATASQMTVKIPITLDASHLAGHDLVTFEDLYLNDNTTKKQMLVYQMNDKNAASEIVHVNLPTNTPNLPQNVVNHTVNTLADTGAKLGNSLWIGLLFIGTALAAGLGFFFHKKRQAKKEM